MKILNLETRGRSRKKVEIRKDIPLHRKGYGFFGFNSNVSFNRGVGIGTCNSISRLAFQCHITNVAIFYSATFVILM